MKRAEELKRFGADDDFVEVMKRLEPPKGSTPASCCQTRGAGLETSAVTISDTASPLPDQGGGELRKFVAMLNDDAAKLEKMWSDLETKGFALHLIGQLKRIAAVYRLCASQLGEFVSEPLTQSGADGDERCHWCSVKSRSVGLDGDSQPWADCPLCGSGSRKERRVSGNA